MDVIYNIQLSQLSSAEEKTKTTFRPLSNLKFIYSPKSLETSVTGQVSSELPPITDKSTRKGNHQTKAKEYINMINDIIKMKLKLAQLNDEISLIDLKINEDTVKFQKAVSEHETFVNSFENFLNQQYEKVKNSLTDLQNCEKESLMLKNTLTKLKNELIRKSLKIYELESVWRKYKTNQDFILHLSALLKKKNRCAREFFHMQSNRMASLDELIENFQRNNEVFQFSQNDFQHLTSNNVLEFLSTLKRQNLKILRYKLNQENAKNNFNGIYNFLQKDLQNKLSSIYTDICRTQTGKKEIVSQTKYVKNQYEDINNRITSSETELSSVHKLIENLYKRCFKVNYEYKSHLQMAKSVEDYCQLLLCTLSSYEPHIVKKATELSKS